MIHHGAPEPNITSQFLSIFQSPVTLKSDGWQNHELHELNV